MLFCSSTIIAPIGTSSACKALFACLSASRIKKSCVMIVFFVVFIMLKLCYTVFFNRAFSVALNDVIAKGLALASQ